MKLFDVYPINDITITRAKGSYVWDDKGQQYLDMYGGHAVISIGHTDPRYVQRLTEQLNNVGFYSNSIRIPLQEELAQKLETLSGKTNYQLFLCNSGAEANENALKLASFHNGRKKIIAFTGSFHGRTSLAVAATDNPSIVAPINENDNVVFLPLNDMDAVEKAIDELTCAVIIEGIQGVSGVRLPDVEFLEKVASLCRDKGALLILDEVQSGYGRTGKFFAHQHAGITPDIITVAKGMGNGFPVGGVLISPAIQAKKEMLGTTFGGSYLACTAAIAVLEVIEKENLMENARIMGSYLREKLKGIPGIKEIRGQGLMVGIELEEPCAPIRQEMLYQHFIFTGSASNKNTIRILPSLAITKREIDVFIAAFQNTLTTKVVA